MVVDDVVKRWWCCNSPEKTSTTQHGKDICLNDKGNLRRIFQQHFGKLHLIGLQINDVAKVFSPFLPFLCIFFAQSSFPAPIPPPPPKNFFCISRCFIPFLWCFSDVAKNNKTQCHKLCPSYFHFPQPTEKGLMWSSFISFCSDSRNTHGSCCPLFLLIKRPKFEIQQHNTISDNGTNLMQPFRKHGVKWTIW